MKHLIKLLIVFLSISAFVACQDEDFTDPSDTSTGEGLSEGSSGVTTQILTAAGESTTDFNFTGAYSTSDWVSASGDSLGLSSAATSDTAGQTKLDLFDTAGEGTYQMTLPVVNTGNFDSDFEATISVPAGAADSAYQVARAYSADLDGDGEEDTIAYAVIVVPGVYYAASGSNSSAHVIAALLLGGNVINNNADTVSSPYGSTYTVGERDYTGAVWADYFGDADNYDTTTQAVLVNGGATATTEPENVAYGTLAGYINNKPMLAIARSVTLSSQADSASGTRTDSGLSVQIIPISLVGQSALVDGMGDNVISAGTLAHAACQGATNGGADNPTATSSPFACTDTSADDLTLIGTVDAIAGALITDSSYVAGDTNDGITGDTTALSLYDADSATEHDIKVNFDLNAAAAGVPIMTVTVTLTDASDNEVVIVSTDSVSDSVAATTAGTNLNSQQLSAAICNESDLLNTASHAATDLTPNYFSNQNVFGAGETCQNTPAPSAVLSDGDTILEKIIDAKAHGYALTLGYVVAAALNPSLDATGAATAYQAVLTASATAGGGTIGTPSVSGISVAIPE